MKKIILKYKIATKLLFVVTIFCFSLSFNITHAADKWFYWYDTPEHEMGSFPTEASCLTAFNTIGSGWTKSDGCYIGGDVKITDFSPMAGGQGSTITITGDNFVRVTKILFGSKVANKSTANISKTSITNLSVPSGAPTGKITIETQARGSAVTTKDFEVTSTNNDPWTFLNIQGQYNGGWATEEECKTKHAEYNTGAGVVPGSSHDTVECVQRPQSQITNSQSLNPVDIDPLKVDGGSGVYKLLAPIGSLEEIDTTGKTCPGNPDIANGIGCYLNIIFKIAIGICAALAVIMLVINGIKYMTSESFTEKSELKKDMLGPIMGLFIALGAFAILNTINPALTGKEGIGVDQVEYEIVVRDRANDTEFMSNIDSFDVSNITVNPSDYNDPAFLGYLSHQQGVGGASAILWAAKKGYSEVPSPNPFVKKANINRNMRSNFNASSAQRTIGTSTLTPANFLKYWATKVAASKKKTSPQIPAVIDNDLIAVATETGVDIATLRAVCRIESHKGCTDATSDPSSITKVNSAGYSGLFQMGKAEFEKYKKSGGVILSAYHNAYAAARYFKSNLSGINKNWPKINN